MQRQEMEHYCVAPWLFGQEGEDCEHKLKTLCEIATYTDLDATGVLQRHNIFFVARD